MAEVWRSMDEEPEKGEVVLLRDYDGEEVLARYHYPDTDGFCWWYSAAPEDPCPCLCDIERWAGWRRLES